MLKKSSRFLLPVLAILTLFLAFIPNSSRWMAVAQFKTVLAPSQNPWSLNNIGAITRNNPNDLDLNIGACNFFVPGVNDIPPRNQIRNINNLIRKFPRQPAAYAIAMSQMTMIGVKTGREKDQELNPAMDKNDPWANVRLSSPTVPLLHLYNKHGIIAEKLDPNNAYFPFMRSVALFGLHRDNSAIREIIRAGNCSVWNDYIKEMILGRFKIADKLGMGGDSIIRNYIIFFVWFPHLVQLRASAQIAIHDAMIMEKKGDVQKGFLIRRGLSNVGKLMELDGTDYLTPSVGFAIAEIAGTAPGGTFFNPPKNISVDKRTEIRIVHYVSYLVKIKHPKEAKAYRSEMEQGLKIKKQILSKTTILGDDTFDLFDSYSIFCIIHLFACIGSSVIILAGILTLLCLGAVAFLVCRIKTSGKYPIGFVIYILCFIVLEYFNYVQVAWFLSVYQRYISSYGIEFNSLTIMPHIVPFAVYASALVTVLPFALSLLIPRIYRRSVPDESPAWIRRTFITLASALTLLWFCVFQLSVYFNQAYLHQHIYTLFR